MSLILWHHYEPTTDELWLEFDPATVTAAKKKGLSTPETWSKFLTHVCDEVARIMPQSWQFAWGHHGRTAVIRCLVSPRDPDGVQVLTLRAKERAA